MKIKKQIPQEPRYPFTKIPPVTSLALSIADLRLKSVSELRAKRMGTQFLVLTAGHVFILVGQIVLVSCLMHLGCCGCGTDQLFVRHAQGRRMLYMTPVCSAKCKPWHIRII